MVYISPRWRSISIAWFSSSIAVPVWPSRWWQIAAHSHDSLPGLLSARRDVALERELPLLLRLVCAGDAQRHRVVALRIDRAIVILQELAEQRVVAQHARLDLADEGVVAQQRA